MAVISLPVTMRELHPLQPPASGSPKLKLVDTGWTSGNHQRRLSYQCPNVYWAVSLVLNRPFLGALDHAGISPECLGSGAEEEDCCVCCQALFPCPGFLSWSLVSTELSASCSWPVSDGLQPEPIKQAAVHGGGGVLHQGRLSQLLQFRQGQAY